MTPSPRPSAPRPAPVPTPRAPARALAPRPAPRAPESTGKLDSAETNPLPNVSTAKVWTPVLRKATAVIREKAPEPARRIRADGTEEIRAEDIMIVVPAPRPRANSTGEIDAGDILSAEPADDIDVEVEEPVFRPPSFSIHATQEILADDVIEVQAAAAQLVVPPPSTPAHAQTAPAQEGAGREEAPSAPPPPWTIDAMDEFEFPSQYPVMSGPYPALSSGPRLTNFSVTEVLRRRSQAMKLVVASVTFAAALVVVAGAAKLAPSAGSNGPVGIVLRSPKSLDSSLRARSRIVGVAASVVAVTMSIDDLAPARRHR